MKKDNKRQKTTKIDVKTCQEIQLEMLKTFAKFCEKNNIKYCLYGGTLLGAIRHKGFIPWDDDIDLLVSRPDFDKLQKLSKNPINDHLKISTPDNGGAYPFIKIFDTRYEIYEPNLDMKNPEYIWLDVFPADGLPDNNRKTNLLFKKNAIFRTCFMQTLLRHDKVASSSKSALKRILKPTTKFLVDLLPTEYYCKKIIETAKTYDYKKSNYIASLTWSKNPNLKILKTSFEKQVLVEFEGSEFYTFSDWDKYLHSAYGNYMELPPKEQRVNHGIELVKH